MQGLLCAPVTLFYNVLAVMQGLLCAVSVPVVPLPYVRMLLMGARLRNAPERLVVNCSVVSRSVVSRSGVNPSLSCPEWAPL